MLRLCRTIPCIGTWDTKCITPQSRSGRRLWSVTFYRQFSPLYYNQDNQPPKRVNRALYVQERGGSTNRVIYNDAMARPSCPFFRPSFILYFPPAWLSSRGKHEGFKQVCRVPYTCSSTNTFSPETKVLRFWWVEPPPPPPGLWISSTPPGQTHIQRRKVVRQSSLAFYLEVFSYKYDMYVRRTRRMPVHPSFHVVFRIRLMNQQF